MFFRFFRRMGMSFARFMTGRRGHDTLGTVLLVFYFLFSLATNFTFGSLVALSILFWISMVFFALYLFRFFSRNYAKREKENQKARKILKKISGFFSGIKNRFRDRKTHKYFKCKACHNTLRVPKGRGSITVTCPVCREKIKKRT